MSKEDRKNLPPPTQILVYDFAMSPGEVSADSAAAGGKEASFRCGAHIAAWGRVPDLVSHLGKVRYVPAADIRKSDTSLRRCALVEGLREGRVPRTRFQESLHGSDWSGDVKVVAREPRVVVI